ncbi:MAG: 2-C-methyl-D-erythritol 2,4-cyclodiphosphate synthase [Sphaerochaetaceae bacterium]|nr:2-C-methyl-D-erythritol 2,4-cyclodiphosphate synthase [Spirochaetales bacterium]MDY5498642.1 2-C-methyl-D-erythritol 2,4-cyclodiphosphate synthase [Sphaerochaetaceae bacterium]
MRIGSGWDLHILVPGRKMMLGGYQVPSPVGEAGHSDGDVLVHAIIDAIYGALAEGDIGSHYPDTDPRYKGIASIELLKDTMTHLGTHRIVNLDSTVILQSPKLRNHIDSIRASLAQATCLSIGQISVKAKTTEHLLENAVIAQATVLLS